MNRSAEPRDEAARATHPLRSVDADRRSGGAFRGFYDRHIAAVLHFLRYQVRDHDRPDVASHAFTLAARHFDRFEPRAGQERDKAERNWILTFARNAASTWRQKKHEPDQTDFETVEAPGNPERETAAFELAVSLLWTLPEHLRSLYLLHHREEMSHDEIAQELGLPLGTVKSRLAAAQAELDATIDRLAARERMKRGDYVRGAVLLPFGSRSIADAIQNVEEELSPEATDHLWSEIATPPGQAAPPIAPPPLRHVLPHGAGGAAAGLTGAKLATLVAAFVVGGGAQYAAQHWPAPDAPAPIAAVDTAPPPPSGGALPAETASGVAVSSTISASAAATAPLPARTVATDVFLTETDAIQAARGALNAGDFGGALRNANKHAKQYPGGAYAPEREAIAIRALAQLGRMAEARKRAAPFRRAFPNSVFRGAVDAATGGSSP